MRGGVKLKESGRCVLEEEQSKRSTEEAATLKSKQDVIDLNGACEGAGFTCS